MPNVAEIIREHVTLDVKCVDRLYLKVHARVLRPGLQALDQRVTARVPPPLRCAFAALDAALEALVKEARLAA